MNYLVNKLLASCIKGLGATLNVAKPTKGSSVAVFGLGAVGLAVSTLLISTEKIVFVLVEYVASS